MDRLTEYLSSILAAVAEDPTVGLCLGPMAVLGGGAVSYERGAPVTGRCTRRLKKG